MCPSIISGQAQVMVALAALGSFKIRNIQLPPANDSVNAFYVQISINTE
jgi:hypothetical protein